MKINNKSLIKDKKANANVIVLAIFTIIMGFGMLTIGTYLYYQIATSADAGTLIASRGTAASGNITFNGNVSNGELFNITNGTAIYRFEFNTSGNGSDTNVVLTANAIRVNVSPPFNSSVQASRNLTTAINANTSAAAFLTADSSTTNVTGLVHDSRGTAGNDVALADTGTNFNVSAATLLGGLNDVTGQAAQNSINSYANIAFPLMGLAMMILGFGVIYYTLRKNFGIGEAR